MNWFGGLLKKIIFLTLLLGFVSCQPEGDGETTTTSPASELSKLPMKWNTSALPLKVKMASDFETEMAGDQEVSGLNLIEQMEDQWNQADPARSYFDVSTRYSVTNKDNTSLNDYLDSEIGIYKSTGWFNNIGSGVLAVTSYLASNKGTWLEMVHGDIIVNYQDFTFSNDPSDVSSAYDLPSVLLHELGHLIGLKHTSSYFVSSVMRPELGMHDVKRNVFSYDSESIQNLYNNNIALTASPLAITAGEDEPVYVQGYIELRADGNCVHYMDGELVEKHKVDFIKN